MSRGKLVILAAAIAVVLVVAAHAVSPAFDGYHLGCNTSVGDNVRVTHDGLLWCKHEETLAEREATETVASPQVTVPGTPSNAELEAAR